MISTLFLNQYVDFRLTHGELVEFYLIDQLQENQFEIIIKDDAPLLEGELLKSAKEKLDNLNLKIPDRYYQYFHKGKNNLKIDISFQKGKIVLADLNHIIGLLMLQHSEKELVFTYLSPKGEYMLNSKDFLSRFTKEELASKEFALLLNELLQDHLIEVIYSDVL